MKFLQLYSTLFITCILTITLSACTSKAIDSRQQPQDNERESPFIDSADSTSNSKNQLSPYKFTVSPELHNHFSDSLLMTVDTAFIYEGYRVTKSAEKFYTHVQDTVIKSGFYREALNLRMRLVSYYAKYFFFKTGNVIDIANHTPLIGYNQQELNKPEWHNSAYTCYRLSRNDIIHLVTDYNNSNYSDLILQDHEEYRVESYIGHLHRESIGDSLISLETTLYWGNWDEEVFGGAHQLNFYSIFDIHGNIRDKIVTANKIVNVGYPDKLKRLGSVKYFNKFPGIYIVQEQDNKSNELDCQSLYNLTTNTLIKEHINCR